MPPSTPSLSSFPPPRATPPPLRWLDAGWHHVPPAGLGGIDPLMSYKAGQVQERVGFPQTNRRRLELSMIHFYDVLTQIFTTKTETAASERPMNVSGTRVRSLESTPREEHSSRERRTAHAPGDSPSLLAPCWGSNGCGNVKCKTQQKRYVEQHAPSACLIFLY